MILMEISHASCEEGPEILDIIITSPSREFNPGRSCKGRTRWPLHQPASFIQGVFLCRLRAHCILSGNYGSYDRKKPGKQLHVNLYIPQTRSCLLVVLNIMLEIF